MSGPAPEEPVADYLLLDSGGGRRLEAFGPRTLDRPCPQADWPRQHDGAAWRQADARYERGRGWTTGSSVAEAWSANLAGLNFELALADSGQVGLFPEHAACWSWLESRLEPGDRLLNLFAHTGGASLVAARAGAEVCHVDGSRPAVKRARANAEANGLADRPIRWIVDDVSRFVEREIRRGRRYEAVLLDPPAFGRGPRGRRWKLDEVLDTTLAAVFELLAETPRFVLLSAHSQGFDQEELVRRLRAHARQPGQLVSGDLLLTGRPPTRPVPAGAWAAWTP